MQIYRQKLALDYVEDIISAYQNLVKKCEENQIAWVQFDEPALVWDMEESDIALFHKIYDGILSCKNTVIFCYRHTLVM